MKRIAIACGSTALLRAAERTLATTPQYGVAWATSDAASTLTQARDDLPDLLLLDARLDQPVVVVRALSGVCGVLLLHDGSPRALATAYDAMAAGATDVSSCPALDDAGKLTGEAGLVAKLRTMASVLGGEPAVKHGAPPLAMRIVLIGSSTGGPNALQVILCALPRDLNAAYCIAQHVDSEFSGGLADWLARACGMPVRLARAGEEPVAGTALIAGTNDHLVLTPQRRLVYTDNPVEAPYRPSADALFASFALHWRDPGIAVLLTGMGKDGAQGMLKLRQAGWHTIAQDAASSVVFGMPKAAIELGAAQEVTSLDDMAPAIARACRGRARSLDKRAR